MILIKCPACGEPIPMKHKQEPQARVYSRRLVNDMDVRFLGACPNCGQEVEL